MRSRFSATADELRRRKVTTARRVNGRDIEHLPEE
jgi:hypothetical protein